VAKVQRRIDKFENSSTKSPFVKEFGTVINNTLNTRIKQRPVDKCITSDESHRFLIEEKEQKQLKLQL
jgi:hypothetical protein